MGSYGHQAKSIISGVSTRPYALREDGHLLDSSENCLLSPKHGLCKRPNSTYLQTVEANTYAKSTAFFYPLLVDNVHYMVVAPDTNSATDQAKEWQVISETGQILPVCHYPSSSHTGRCAVENYVLRGARFGPRTTSAATIGDVTFIADEGVVPKMLDATTEWQGGWPYAGGSPHPNIPDNTSYDGNKDRKMAKWLGYHIPVGEGGYNDDGIESPASTAENDIDLVTSPITNDDVFVYWVKNVVYTSAYKRYHILTFKEDIGGTQSTYKVQVKSRKDGDNATLFRLDNAVTHSNDHCWPDGQTIAALQAYQLSNKENTAGHHMIQATSLDTRSFNSETSQISRNGIDCVLGMYVNQDRGTFTSITQSGSDGEGSKVLAHKNVDTIADLPPNAFLNQTLKVGDQDSPHGFFMRYVSDDAIIAEYSNNFGSGEGYHAKGQVDKTVLIPRTGHWEEYCGVGVDQHIDAATMPLLLVRRPDNTFGLMEARGEFAVNTEDRTCYFYTSGDNLRIDMDNGFGYFTSATAPEENLSAHPRVFPLAIGDTIRFELKSGSFPGTGEGFDPLSEDRDYYVVSYATDPTADTGDSNLGLGAGDILIRIAETPGGEKINFLGNKLVEMDVYVTTYKDFEWQPRVAGDDTTNPVPEFIGQKITSLFSFQDRLGCVTPSTVTFSGTGDYFNLFRTTVRDLDSSDPFTVAPNLTKGDSLRKAVPFERELILLANEAQYTVKATEGLSAQTVAIVQSSNVSTGVYPGIAPVGSDLYLSTTAADSSGVVSLRKSRQSADRFDVFDTSVNIPGFLPHAPIKMTGSSKHNMMFYLDNGLTSRTELYVYSWLDTKDGRLQSAWSKWTFGEEYNIHDIEYFGDRLYMLTSQTASTNPTQLLLEYIDLDLTTVDDRLGGDERNLFQRCLIDRQTHNVYSNSTGHDAPPAFLGADHQGGYGGIWYESTTGGTTIYLRWRTTAADMQRLVVVSGAGEGFGVPSGTIYRYSAGGEPGTLSIWHTQPLTQKMGTTTTEYATKIVVNGVDLTTQSYYIGYEYPMKASFGPFIPSYEDRPLAGRNVFAKTGRLTYSMANKFTIDIEQNGSTYTQTVDAGQRGNLGPEVREGDCIFAIRKDLPSLGFTINNNEPWNTMFQILKYDFSVQEIAGG